MIKKILRFLTGRQKTQNDFSDFFRYGSKEEQARIYREALRKANEEQRQIYKEAKNP